MNNEQNVQLSSGVCALGELLGVLHIYVNIHS